MRRSLFWLVTLSFFLSNGCMLARDSKMIDSRLATVESRQAKLQKQLSSAKALSKDKQQVLQSQYASLKASFKASQEDLRLLRGELEETRHELQKHIKAFEAAQEKNRQRIYAMDKALLRRLSKLEHYLGFEEKTASAGGEEDAAGAETTDKAPETATEAYSFARRLFDLGDYQAARDAFAKLLKDFPESDKCDNAQFWIGETYYQEKWYEKAILEYQKVLEEYPDGNKIPAALLKQGLAFHNIEEDKNARLVLKKLIREHPGANESKIAKKKLEKF